MAEQSGSSTGRGGETPGPVVLAINVCDMAIRDELTHKASLIGLFSTIRAISFPCTHGVMIVHVALTGGHGTQSMEIKLVRLKDEKPVMAMTGDLKFTDPLQVIELIFEWRGVRFDEPGHYAIEVCCSKNPVPIGSRKINVVAMGQLPPISESQGG